MHPLSRAAFSSERGAILIHVAIAITVLAGFSVFIVDQGIMWTARAQAQNAADAGALAGAVARALDDLRDPPPSGGLVEQAAREAAQSNSVWAATLPDSAVQISWPSCPGGVTGTCLEVKVYRDGSNGSTGLPSFFAPIFGVSSLQTKAYALGNAGNANYTASLKPWLVGDRWTGNFPNGFNPSSGDVYTPPSSGTGYSTGDVGTAMSLALGAPNAPNRMLGASYYEFGDPSQYAAYITGNGITASIGDAIVTHPPIGGGGGPLDENGNVTPIRSLLINGPVVVPIALVSPIEFSANQNTSGVFTVHIVNIIGFRLTSVDDDGTLHGTLVPTIGEINPSSPQVTGSASLLKAVRLVR